MDALDLDLVRLLREDARAPYVELARRVGVSEKTVRQRVARLVDSAGLRFRAELDRPAGHVHVVFLLTTRAGCRLSEADRLAGLPAIDSVRLTSGDCDILAEASFASGSDALQFGEIELAAAPGIADVRTIPVIGEVRAGQLPSDERLRAFDTAAADLDSTEDVLDLACDAVAALYETQRVFAGLLATPESDIASAPLFSPAIRWRGLSSRYIAGIYENLRRGAGVPTGRSRGQHLFVADALDDPTFAKVADLVRAEGFRSFLSLPIMRAQRHLGNVNVYFDDVTRYDADLVAQGQELADLLAAHLERVAT